MIILDAPCIIDAKSRSDSVPINSHVQNVQW